MSTTLRACIVLVFLLAASRLACAQSGASPVTLTGRVSSAISVSASEARALGDNTRVSTAEVDANTVAVSISGSGGGVARVSLPLRLRSNAGYQLRASFLSAGELNARLSVARVRATGKLVHANAAAGVRLDAALADAQAGPRAERAAFVTAQKSSPQFALLTGPPVSKAGTFTSPDNAIEIVLLVELLPQARTDSWSTQLTISVAPHTHAGR